MSRRVLVASVAVFLLLGPIGADAKKRRGSRAGKGSGKAGRVGGDVRQLLEAGGELAAAGRVAEAEAAFSAVLAAQPTSLAALGNRALLLPALGRSAEAVCCHRSSACGRCSPLSRH